MVQAPHWKWTLLLGMLTALAAFLRLYLLGTTFQSSDNVELAVRILQRPGYAWMADEPYGIFISLWVKLWAGFLSMLGVALNEFWWKAGVALAGALQVPLGYRLLRRMRVGEGSALLGAGLLAVLPIHIFQSRYLWGYEVLGALFLLPALTALLDYWASPARRSGLKASLWIALYLLSHGYFLPFAPVFLLVMALAAPGERILPRMVQGLKSVVVNLVWLFPLLAYPLYRVPLRHALAKQSQFGFYFDDHFEGFMGNLGWPLLLLIGVVLVGMLVRQRPVPRNALLFFGAGACYLAPLFFGSPPGITVVRGYMLVGCVLWVVAMAMAVDAFPGKWKRGLQAAAWGVALWTAAGTATILYTWRPALGTAVLVERGSVSRDPGTKAAGYLVRKHLKPETHVMAIHRALEPPNAWYYLGRADSSWFDLDLARSLAKFRQSQGWTDVLISDREQADSLQGVPEFELRLRVLSHGESKVFFFTRPHIAMPAGDFDYAPFNAAFDKEFSPIFY